VLWERGLVALETGKPAEAEPWLRRAVRLLPYERPILHALFRCLVELNRGAEAEKVKARVAQLDADRERLNQLRQEVMKRPNDAALRREGGLLLLRNGALAEGIRWLRLALRLDPGSEATRQALANAESRQKP